MMFYFIMDILFETFFSCDKRLMINSLAPELSSQCTLQRTRNLSYRVTLHVHGNDFSEYEVLSTSHCVLTVVNFWRERVNELC